MLFRSVLHQQAPVTDTTSALKRKTPEGADGDMPVAPMDDATATLRPKTITPETQVSQAVPGDSDATALLRPAPKPQTEVPGIQDPMALRDSDTSRLARIKPGQNPNDPNAGRRATDDTLDTETVHLKVIKEKKKQLAGILSASQTIRLRPSSGPDSAPAPRVPGLAQRGSSAPASKKTLKVKAPSPEELKDTRTATLKRQKAPTEEPDQNVKRPTLKIKAPTVKSDTPTQDSDAVPPPGGAAGKSTLKIKAPSGPPSAAPPSEETPAAPQKSTLKIKAPSGPPGAPERPPTSEDAPGKTVKQEAPRKKDRTLKLRSKRDRTTEAAPMDAGTAATPVEAPADSGVRPGVLYILSAVASLGLIGGTLYFIIMGYDQIVGF